MYHPLMPSPKFLNTEVATQFVQSCLFVPTIPAKITMFVASIIARNIPLIPPLHKILYLPSSLVFSVTGIQAPECEKKLRRIGCMAPVAGIALATFAAHISYLSFSSAAIKGVIFGVHSAAMMMFTVSPASWSGLITLRSCLHGLLIDPSKYNIESTELRKINQTTENITALTFAISAIALSVICANPILANAIAYPIATNVAIASTRFLMSRAQKIAVLE
ncbi:MAG: hypothetical protein LW832_05350 [Parachlamydia sp.]|jgi:hypothetical protein|nr:hypothetical protein [Parachlamydia sp.]